jgi:hypothetical protein
VPSRNTGGWNVPRSPSSISVSCNGECRRSGSPLAPKIPCRDGRSLRGFPEPGTCAKWIWKNSQSEYRRCPIQRKPASTKWFGCGTLDRLAHWLTRRSSVRVTDLGPGSVEFDDSQCCQSELLSIPNQAIVNGALNRPKVTETQQPEYRYRT